MHEFRRSPTTALVWEIWARNRRWFCVAGGIVLFGWLLKFLLPDAHEIHSNSLLSGLYSMLAGISFLIVFGIFNYTEVNARQESAGFPGRLFALPVSSLLLVTVPVCFGVICIELLYLVLTRLDASRVEEKALTAVLLGAFMVVYQSVLWTLDRFGPLRTIVLGLIGMIFFAIGFLPTFPQSSDSAARALETLWIERAAGFALVSFLFSWMYVARLRSGGGPGRNSYNIPIDRLADVLLSRRKPFASAAAAQFWFEWRRAGTVLPLLIGGLLIAVIGPMSWSLQNDGAACSRILIATLAMPIILALPVAKGFSKPDFWSPEMSLPSYLAVRPLATEDIVLIKAKVAALSSGISWFLVLLFLSVCLPLWPEVDGLHWLRVSLWEVYGGSTYAIAMLSLLVGIFLTWRFLVGSLWLGLSGNRKLYAVSAAPYAFVPVFGLIGLVVLRRHTQSIFNWVQQHQDRVLLVLEWTVVLAILAKFCVAALSWREAGWRNLHHYLPVWLGSTACLIALAILLTTGLPRVPPSVISRVRVVLILMSVLSVPVARMGLAQLLLATNRHR